MSKPADSSRAAARIRIGVDIGPVFGHLDDADMMAVNRALALFAGIASRP